MEKISDYLILPEMLKISPKFVKYTIKNKKNFEDIAEVFENLKKEKNPDIFLVFRGQSDYSWALTTTQERYISDIRNLGENSKINYENYCWENVKNILKAKLNDLEKKRFELENYAKLFSFLQHYGAPTRLLDFTFNFKIATAFALDPISKTDSAVYAINLKPIERKTVTSEKNNDSIEFTLNSEMIFNDIMNFRISYQRETNQGKTLQNFPIISYLDLREKFSRLNKQEGIFLYSTSFDKMFQEQLFQIPRNADSNKPNDVKENDWKILNKIDKIKDTEPEFKKLSTNMGEKLILESEKYLIFKIKIKQKAKRDIYDLIKTEYSMDELFPAADELKNNVEGLMRDLKFRISYNDLKPE